MSVTDTHLSEFCLKAGPLICLTKGKLSSILDTTDTKFLEPWEGGRGFDRKVLWEVDDRALASQLCGESEGGGGLG